MHKEDIEVPIELLSSLPLELRLMKSWGWKMTGSHNCSIYDPHIPTKWLSCNFLKL